MRAHLSECRDLVGKYFDLSLYSASNNLFGNLGVRTINTMAFMVFTNIPKDVTINTPYGGVIVPGYRPEYCTMANSLSFIPGLFPGIVVKIPQWEWERDYLPRLDPATFGYDTLAEISRLRAAILLFAFQTNNMVDAPSGLGGSYNDIRASEDLSHPKWWRYVPSGVSANARPVNVPIEDMVSGTWENLSLFEAPQSVPGGYRFKGWYTVSSSSLITINGATKPIEGITPQMADKCSSGGFPYITHASSFGNIPSLPEDYTRLVWSDCAMYGANHLLEDSQLMGAVRWGRYFNRYEADDYYHNEAPAWHSTQMLHAGTIIISGHKFTNYPGDTTKPSWINVSKLPRQSYLAMESRWALMPRVMPALYIPQGENPRPPHITAEGTVYKYNLLMAKYVRGVTVRFIFLDAVATFDANGTISFARTLEIGENALNTGVAIGAVPAYTMADYSAQNPPTHPLFIQGFYIGDMRSDRPQSDPGCIKATAQTVITSDTTVWAHWGRMLNIDAKPGVFDLWAMTGRDVYGEYSWHSAGANANLGGGWGVPVCRNNKTYLRFKMFGDYGYFNESQSIYDSRGRLVSKGWTDLVSDGETGYYVAKRTSDNYPVSWIYGKPAWIVDPDPVNPPDMDYYVVANIPIQIGPGIATATYKIGDAAPVTAAPNTHGVVWINDVPVGSTVKVWGTASDSSNQANAWSEATAMTFTADGSAKIVYFHFYLCVGSFDVYEVAFDSLFFFSEYIATLALAGQSGRFLTQTNSKVSTKFYVTVQYDYAFTIFADSDSAETVYGSACSSMPVVAGSEYAFAVGQTCALVSAGGSDSQIFSGSGDFVNCSARVVFLDEDGLVITDALGAEITYRIPATGTPHVVYFTAPDHAVAAQAVFAVDAGYKSNIYAVRLCLREIYDECQTEGARPPSVVSAEVLRWWLTKEEDGPNYGSRHTLPKATRQSGEFAGWATSQGVAITSDTPIIENRGITFNSIWLGASVAVILNAMGGRFVRELDDGSLTTDPDAFYQRRRVGDAYGALPTPVRADGKDFAGWWTAEVGGTRILPSTIVPAASYITLYARWGSTSPERRHDLCFNPVGGTVGENVRKLQEGAPFGLLPTPVFTGHTFLGWFTEANGGEPVTAEWTMGFYDITVYAHWSSGGAVQWGYVRYTIDLKTNGGTVSDSYGQLKYVSGIAKALPAAAEISKSGATFAGWYESPDFSGSAVTEIPADSKGKRTFYAKWL